MGCKNFFNAGHAKGELGTKLQQVNDVLAWELETASDFSPGVVENEEIILRQIFSPIHVDANGKITPSGLNEAFTHGLSTNRLKYISEFDVVNKGIIKQDMDNQHPDKTDRKFVGIAEFVVSEIRGLTDQTGIKGLAVFDTALKDDTSHSDVFCFKPKQNWRSLRSKLLPLANDKFRLLSIIPSR